MSQIKVLRAFAGLLLALGFLTAPSTNVSAVSAAQPQQVKHCARMVAPAGQATQAPTMTCFDNFSDAISFATGGKVQLPKNESGPKAHAMLKEQLASGGGGGASAQRDPGQTLLAIDYDNANFDASAGSLETYTYNPNGCYDGSTYSWPYMDAGWDDRVSSADTFQGCAHYYVYANPNYGGSVHICPCLNMDVLNNQGSSEYLAP